MLNAIQVLQIGQLDGVVAGASKQNVLINHHAQDALIMQLLLSYRFVGEHFGHVKDALRAP